MFKKRKVNPISPENWNKEEFDTSMSYIQSVLKEPKDKEIILNYFLELIKNDLKYSLLCSVIYSKQYKSINFCDPFVFECFDENKNPIRRILVNEQKQICLKSDCVLVAPSDMNKYKDMIKHLSKQNVNFEQDNNHIGVYISPLNIVCISNGRHSIGSGVGLKKGNLCLKHYDISNMFQHLTSNGTHWINAHTGEEIGSILDYRIALIYEISKMLYSNQKANYLN